eukprot:TRINITY_DN1567_c0_g1_i1.p1 TRINITY_DN1567_c0_g1~~TRINITY_DN1567_c0_g1_i1.p1  ORF type:complete len:541 (+),score=156.23 TRINITY_DN1567_c0_g1_i1:137-1759(+)
MRNLFFALVLLVAFTAAALDKIEIKGSKMFNSRTGEQFWVRGVAYAPKEFPLNHDPLADVEGIKRDIPEFTKLGINTIRVYQSFVTNQHDEVMQLLEDAGIYVMLDLMDPLNAVNRDDPSWTTTLSKVLFDKVDSFSTHNNLLAFIAGNEVTNQVSNSEASTYTKACIRDVRAYIKSKGLSIPVGYATADAETVSTYIQDFFDCGEQDTRADFYGINTYRWCGNSNFQEAYSSITQTFATWDVPVILTEFGCNIVADNIRPFTEIGSIFGPDMENVFSGGVAYEYAVSSRKYGLVAVNDDNTVTELQDFTNLMNELAKTKTQQGTTKDAYTPSGTQRTCPNIDDNWKASAILPPAVDEERCQCLASQFTCRTIMTDPTQADTIGKQLGDVFAALCGTYPQFCNTVASDGTLGIYGNFSMCDALIRASLVLNYHYLATGQCDVNGEGIAQVVTASTAPATCSKYTDSVSIEALGLPSTSSSTSSFTSDSNSDNATSNNVKSTSSLEDGRTVTETADVQTFTSPASALKLSFFGLAILLLSL